MPDVETKSPAVGEPLRGRKALQAVQSELLAMKEAQITWKIGAQDSLATRSVPALLSTPMPSFTDAKKLVDWMQSEYLSELLLRKATPKPSAPAKPRPPKDGVVTMEWGLVLPDQENKLAAYLLRAEGVTAWSLDGEWDKHGELELRSIANGSGGIVFDLRAPGRFSLVCKRVSIEAGPLRRYDPPRRPDDTSLLFWGAREITWADLWQWLAPAADMQLFRQRSNGHVLVPADERRRPIQSPCYDTFCIQRSAGDARPSMFVGWSQSVGTTGHYFTVTRDALSDHAAWSRALRLPEHLGECEVLSGGIRTTGVLWLRDWVPRVEAELAPGPLVPPVYKRAADDD